MAQKGLGIKEVGVTRGIRFSVSGMTSHQSSPGPGDTALPELQL